jgi:hypothetical protein
VWWSTRSADAREDPANYVHEQAWSHFFDGSLGHPGGTISGPPA